MLKIYPRGYIGPMLDNFDKDSSHVSEVMIVQNTYKLATYKPTSITCDEEIEYLFNCYTKNNQEMLKFSFREDILKKAKQLFSFAGNARSFKTFVDVQLASGKMTYNHIEVLKEVFDFIHFNKVGLKIVTWERILSNEYKVVHIKDKDRKDLSKIFDMYPPLTVNNAIIKWVSNYDGYPHLLKTLWLFFGDKLIDER